MSLTRIEKVCAIDRIVGMRVIFTDNITDHTGRFAIGLVMLVTLLVHRKEDAAMHGLEPVAHVGQRPAHDHAHRVIEVGFAHLVGYRDRVDVGRQHAARVIFWRICHDARSALILLALGLFDSECRCQFCTPS
jgi:hypothetical protein